MNWPAESGKLQSLGQTDSFCDSVSWSGTFFSAILNGPFVSLVSFVFLAVDLAAVEPFDATKVNTISEQSSDSLLSHYMTEKVKKMIVRMD